MSNTAGKRYQVFVSSTFRDLKEERQAVLDSILEMGHIPTGMEMFPASNETPLEIIERAIIDCDYYVLIIAAMYGSVDQEHGISFTEREFDLAAKHQKHILPFLHSDPGNLPANRADVKPKVKKKLEDFRKKVEQGPHCKYWESASDLKYKVVLAMQHAMSYFPQVGWVRADQVGNHDLMARLVDLQERFDNVVVEKDRIESELMELQSDPQKDLAFGDDMVEIEFSQVRCTDGGVFSPEPVRMKWSEIFFLTANLCIPKAIESHVAKRLSGFASPRGLDSGFDIKESSFFVIRTKLLAHQLIHVDSETIYYPERMNPPNPYGHLNPVYTQTKPDSGPVYAQRPKQVTFWRLTPRGNLLFLSRNAIPRDDRAVQDRPLDE